MTVSMRRHLGRYLETRARRRAKRRACRTALRRFEQLHAHWYALRFDDAFVARLAEEVLAAGDAAAIAREWTRQYVYRDVRQRERDLRQVTPVAASFLNLLATAEAELVARRQKEALPVPAAVRGVFSRTS